MPDDQLNQAIALIKSGDHTTAQRILTQLVQQDPNNEGGWMWLSTCVESIEQKKSCLKRALAINPTNNAAGQALAHLNTLVELPSMADMVATPSSKIAATNSETSRSGASLPSSRLETSIQVNQPRNYINQNLMRGEQVIYETHLHWIVFMAPIVAAVASVAFFVVFSKVDRTYGPTLGLIFGVPFLAAVPFLFLTAIVVRRTSEYAVTNKRVLIKYGVIRHHSLELLLVKVEGIMVDQTLMGRVFDYGTLIVNGTGGTHERFKNITQPLEFRRQVQHQIALIAGDR